MIPSEAMRRNALTFDAFCLRAEARGLKVTVGLSAKAPAVEHEPPNDLVVRVISTDTTSRDPVSLSERVTGTLAETLGLLEQQIGMGAV